VSPGARFWWVNFSQAGLQELDRGEALAGGRDPLIWINRYIERRKTVALLEVSEPWRRLPAGQRRALAAPVERGVLSFLTSSVPAGRQRRGGLFAQPPEKPQHRNASLGPEPPSESAKVILRDVGALNDFYLTITKDQFLQQPAGAMPDPLRWPLFLWLRCTLAVSLLAIQQLGRLSSARRQAFSCQVFL